jgi:endoglucanase
MKRFASLLLILTFLAGCVPAIRVSGNKLVNQTGQQVQLVGVNRSGTQYACSEGWGVFDGPSSNTSINAIKAWRANTIRVSLNAACWLGLSSVPAAYRGVTYQNTIADYVSRINALGMYVIIDMHRPGLEPDDEPSMPDRQTSSTFWQSVGNRFKTSPMVLFDLYNEPYPDDNENTTFAWNCVRNGGSCPGVVFIAAGMQEMLNAVRSSGAQNVVLIAGPQYAGVVDRWREFMPSDPLATDQLAASIHIYYNTPNDPEWAPCYQPSCWNATIAPLLQTHPVVIGELGELDCDSDLIEPLLDWSDQRKVSYIAWSWMTSDCNDEPALITNYNGTPTNYGLGFRNHLLSR